MTIPINELIVWTKFTDALPEVSDFVAPSNLNDPDGTLAAVNSHSTFVIPTLTQTSPCIITNIRVTQGTPSRVMRGQFLMTKATFDSIVAGVPDWENRGYWAPLGTNVFIPANQPVFNHDVRAYGIIETINGQDGIWGLFPYVDDTTRDIFLAWIQGIYPASTFQVGYFAETTSQPDPCTVKSYLVVDDSLPLGNDQLVFQDNSLFWAQDYQRLQGTVNTRVVTMQETVDPTA